MMEGNHRGRRDRAEANRGRRWGVAAAVVALVLAGAWAAMAADPAPKDDPLIRMPGSQPGQVALESPNRCLNCHGGYNTAVEPGFNWQGSMMAQSARDPLFWAAMTVAAQDSMWAMGNANATDLCLRCHFPKGWLEGRSDPTNAAAMVGADYDGVQCDFCHRMWDPFFDTTHSGVREGTDWLAYWDETDASDTPSQPAADATRVADSTQAQAIERFDGTAFFSGDRPFSTDYDEATSGQFFVSSDAAKRAPFADAEARHQMNYSRFHKSKYFCGTCHDVSNPVLANLDEPLQTESKAAYSYFHVERTFSEFMLSDYGQPGGAPGKGPFAPGAYETSYANDYIAKCQDCHMRDEIGAGADKRGVPIRPNDSVEHPESGQPLHDLTGGNVWVPALLASAVPGSPNYDPFNEMLLTQGPAVLTLDLTQGLGIDPATMLAGRDRAEQQLLLAAALENVSYNAGSGELSFRLQNQTGHRLISGFPEGRRMFVNVRAYDAGGSLIYEVNPYDEAAGTLKGLSYPYQPDLDAPASLGSGEVYVDELVYEMHPGSTLTGEEESFHFVLSDTRYKDNRIPPKGFRIGEAVARQSIPVWHGVEDPSYFTSAEYAGGWDDVSLTIATGAASVEVGLYYQTTSREYIEFLRDEINGTTGNLTLPPQTQPPLPPRDPSESPYVVQTDPFFAQLRAWGDTIWQLWLHNKDLPGAAPFLMTQAVVGDPGGGQNPPAAPVLESAVPGHQQVALDWSAVSGADSYTLYYDQADKAQVVASGLTVTDYVDSGLSNGQEYCYKVTAVNAVGESGYSNILCAVPNNQGQAQVTITALETGRYETTGKGKNKVTVFVPTDTFVPGDGVVFRVHVADVSTGLPLSNATVDLSITGPETAALVTGPSDGDGIAEATWQTEAPRKGKGGTAPGSYTATTANVAATGYTWDAVPAVAAFSIQ